MSVKWTIIWSPNEAVFKEWKHCIIEGLFRQRIEFKTDGGENIELCGSWMRVKEEEAKKEKGYKIKETINIVEGL